MNSLPHEKESNALIEAALNLFQASGAEAFILPIPNTSPTVYVAAGSPEQTMEDVRDVMPAQQQQADHIPDATKMVQGDDELADSVSRLISAGIKLSLRGYSNVPAKRDFQDAMADTTKALANYRARKGEQHAPADD